MTSALEPTALIIVIAILAVRKVKISLQVVCIRKR